MWLLIKSCLPTLTFMLFLTYVLLLKTSISVFIENLKQLLQQLQYES